MSAFGKMFCDKRESERTMSRDEAAIEQEIQDKGLNAPRLTPALIDAQIVDEDYHVFPGTTLTVCALTLQNGFQVVGHSASASPENFNEELGRKIARDKARDQIWALEGYLLREVLSERGRVVKVPRDGSIIIVGESEADYISRAEIAHGLAEMSAAEIVRGLVSKGRQAAASNVAAGDEDIREVCEKAGAQIRT